MIAQNIIGHTSVLKNSLSNKESGTNVVLSNNIVVWSSIVEYDEIEYYYTLHNISRQPITLIVDDPINSITPFDGSGIVMLQPNEKITVEEDRLNLGQIETLKKNKFLHTLISATL